MSDFLVVWTAVWIVFLLVTSYFWWRNNAVYRLRHKILSAEGPYNQVRARYMALPTYGEMYSRFWKSLRSIEREIGEVEDY